jgi:predicted permease
MKQLRRAVYRFRGVFRARAIEREMEEELESHLLLHIDENLQRGMTPVAAREQAHLFLGDQAQVRRQYRAEALFPFLLHRIQDFAHSLADLRRHAIYTAVLICTLSIGMGMVTALLGVLHNVVIAPYPYAHSESMYHLLVKDQRGFLVWPLYTRADLLRVRSAHPVEAAIGYRNRLLRYAGEDGSASVVATDLTLNAWHYLGVPVLLGRGLEATDIPLQKNTPVVLGYVFWEKHLQRDKDIVGKFIQFDQQPYKVVGVARPHFSWGNGSIFLPADVSDPSARDFEINLRLRPGISAAAAQKDLGALLTSIRDEAPDRFPQHFLTHLTSLNEPFAKHSIPPLRILMAAAIILCLVVFANLWLFASSRIDAHKQLLEAFRQIGAGRGRLFGYLLTDAALISLASSTAALFVALPLTPLLQMALPAYSFPSEAPSHLGMAACGVCALLGLLCFATLANVAGIICFQGKSLAPVTSGSGRDVLARLQFAFTVGQVALTVVLLFAAGIAAQTYFRLVHKPLGYDSAHVLIGNIAVNESKYPTWPSRSGYFDNLLHEIGQALPTQEVALASFATPPNSGIQTSAIVSSLPAQPVSVHFVSSSYFAVLRVPLVRGSMWANSEDGGRSPVVVINETAQRLLFPNRSPMGEELRLPRLSYLQYSLPGPSDGALLRVVGVVRDFRSDGLDKPIMPAVYLPIADLLNRDTQILVRTFDSPTLAQKALLGRLAVVDSSQALGMPLRPLNELTLNEPGRVRAKLLSVLCCLLFSCALITGFSGMAGRWRLRRTDRNIPCQRGFGLLPASELRASAKAASLGLFAGLLIVQAVMPRVETSFTGNASFTPEPSRALLLAGIAVLACLMWSLGSRLFTKTSSA